MVSVTKSRTRVMLSSITIGMYILLCIAANRLNVPASQILISGFIITVITAISFLSSKVYGEKLQKIAFLIVPYFVLRVVEYLQNGELTLDNPMLWINLAIYFSLYIFLFTLTNRIKLSIILPSYIILLLGIANHYVIIFREAALQPWDFFTVGTAINVAGNIQLTIDWSVVLALFSFLLVTAIALCCDIKFTAKRIYGFGMSICLAAISFVTVNYNIVPANFNDFFTVDVSRDNGLILNLLIKSENLFNIPPKGYDKDEILMVMEELDEETNVSGSKPNIIIIMNESFSDLSIYGDLKTNEDPMPFIRGLQDNTKKGKLIVSAFGGGTANPEYECLTGNLAFMLRNGSYPLQQFVTNESPSLAYTLKAQGYKTIAMHPYFESGWNRNVAYPLLGFDEFLSYDDFQNVEHVRKYISDRSNYQKIIEQFENKGDTPIFVHNVTMQNHSSYNQKYANFEETITFEGEEEFPKTKQYLSLVKETDIATKELLDYFSDVDEETIILFFGDHQPVIEDEFYDKLIADNDIAPEDVDLLKHTVPFFLWANYDIAEEDDMLLSTNYLSNLILDTAGLEKTQYDKYLAELQKTLPVISVAGCIDNEGNYFYYTGEEGPHIELLNQYRNIQYNQVLDKNSQTNALYYLDIEQ